MANGREPDIVDIECASTYELLEELRHRFPQLLFCGLRETEGDSEHEDHLVEWRGGLTTAIGLAERARNALCRKAVENELHE